MGHEFRAEQVHQVLWHAAPDGPTVLSNPALVDDAVRWLNEHQDGWVMTYVTYVPHLEFRGDTFHANFFDHSVVLNIQEGERWVQLVWSGPKGQEAILDPTR